MRIGRAIAAAALTLSLASPALAQQSGEAKTAAPGEAGAPPAGDAASALHLLDGGMIVADQTLVAVVSNVGIGSVVALDDPAGFRTGSIAIGDEAFASFSGILAQSLNSGVNANVQAAANVVIGGSLATAAQSLRTENLR